MRNPFVSGVGGVLSADIAVPEHERELAFYSSILTTGDSPLWQEDLMNNLGMPVIGLGARTPEYDNLPLQWMPHFQVADVGQSAAAATSSGGKELMHSKTADGQSQWAVLVDPDGAAFGIIPVVPQESDLENQSDHFGCISWLSLTVVDANKSADFYQKVVGWTPKCLETDDSDGQLNSFEMEIDSQLAAAEICQQRDQKTEIPSVWLISLPVDDLAESLNRVTAGGGTVALESSEDNFTIVRDPVGVYFALQSV